MCPLTQLLFWRVTSGLYYDVISDSRSSNLIGTAFEEFKSALLGAAYPDSELLRETPYGTKKSGLKTPDLLMHLSGVIDIAFECKAKRIPLAVQVDESESTAYDLAVSELAKGVFQLARFRSDIRRGAVPNLTESKDSQYVVLALDPWVFTGPTTKGDVFEKAEALLSRKNVIIEFDIREIAFCTAADLDNMACRLTIGEMKQVFGRNRDQEFREHSAISVLLDLFPGKPKGKDYPLSHLLDELSAGIKER